MSDVNELELFEKDEGVGANAAPEPETVYLTKFDQDQLVEFKTFLRISISNLVTKLVAHHKPEPTGRSLKMAVGSILYAYFDEFNMEYTINKDEDEVFDFDLLVHFKNHDGQYTSWNFNFKFDDTALSDGS